MRNAYYDFIQPKKVNPRWDVSLAKQEPRKIFDREGSFNWKYPFVRSQLEVIVIDWKLGANGGTSSSLGYVQAAANAQMVARISANFIGRHVSRWVK